MKRSPNYTKKLSLNHAAVREIEVRELERVDGGGTLDPIIIDEPVYPSEPVYRPEKPGDEYVVTC